MKLDNKPSMPAMCALAVWFSASCSAGLRTPESAPTQVRGTVTGTATYSERIDLPVDAVFEATLLDVSRLDAPGTAVGYTVIVSPQDLPIRFAITTDSTLIDRERNYAVRARILSGDRPLWVSDRAYPVLTHGAGNSVDITLRRTGSAEFQTPEDSVVTLSGELTYLADLARLTECSSRRVFPVSTEADFARLLSTYLELARPPGTPVFVTFDGNIAARQRPTGVGTAATVVVREFIGAWPDQSCASAATTPPLVRTPWRITVLNGVRLTRNPGHQQPHLQLQRDSSGTRYSATVGCNGIGGEVTIAAGEISFGPGTGTMMSCGTPLDSLERQLRDALDQAASWDIRANMLRLRDESGATVALLEPQRIP